MSAAVNTSDRPRYETVLAYLLLNAVAELNAHSAATRTHPAWGSVVLWPICLLKLGLGSLFGSFPERSLATMTGSPRYIRTFIKGVPYGGKGHGSAGAQGWTSCVKSATEHLGRVEDACIVNVTFHLHPMNYRSIQHGTDIDNLLNRLFDALKETIFSRHPVGTRASFRCTP